MLICSVCNASITEGGKFCPQCGSPVTKVNNNNPLVSQDVAHVSIRFGYSSSSNYSTAVSLCEKLPSYQASGDGKNIQHSIVLPITEVEFLLNLYELVGSWKSSRMMINGHFATKKNLVFHGVGCYRTRQKAYKPEQYCFGERAHEANIWGCKRLNMPINEWGFGWLDYGQFDTSGVWHFDKEHIQHDLELGMKENELCPVLNRRKVLETLNRLPNSINPKMDRRWQYRTEFRSTPNGYQEVAVGIKPAQLREVGVYVVDEFQPDWDHPEDVSSNLTTSVVHANTDTLKERPNDQSRARTLQLITSGVKSLFRRRS